MQGQSGKSDSAQRRIVNAELRVESHIRYLVVGSQLHERLEDENPMVLTAEVQCETVLWQVDQLFAARWTVER